MDYVEGATASTVFNLCPSTEILRPEEFEEKYEEFENKIWRNTSIHSVIPSFTMNESINK